MLAERLAQHIDVPLEDIQRLLSLTTVSMWHDPQYRLLARQVDPMHLVHTLQEAKSALDHQLPPIIERFKAAYDIEHFPLNSYMFSNAILTFGTSDDARMHLQYVHRHIPIEIMRATVPAILDVFDTLPRDSNMWQKSFSIMMLPLIVEA